MGPITFPLLLIASFGIVLEGHESVGRMLLNYFVIALVTYLATVLVLANVVEVITALLPEFVRDLPQMIAETGQELTAEESDLLNSIGISLFRKIMTQLIPGDGTIRLDYLNTVLEQLNTGITVPDMETLRTMFTSTGLTEDLFDLLVRAVASLDADKTYHVLSRIVETLLSLIPFDLADLLQDYVMPYVSSMFISRLNFNVFWDLFLYTLFYCFTCTHPKGLKGGRLLLFRCCAVFPAGWLLISAILSGLARSFTITLSAPLAAALSTRGLPALLVFFLMVLFQKYREAEMAVEDPTGGTWLAYTKTDRAALAFSRFGWITLIGVSLLDFLLALIPSLSLMGIGTGSTMWLGGPFLQLYSYNKRPKHRWLNIVVPLYYVLHYVIVVLFTMGILEILLEMFMVE